MCGGSQSQTTTLPGEIVSRLDHEGRLPLASPEGCAGLIAALRDGEHGSVDHRVRSWACLRPDDPDLVAVSALMPTDRLPDTSAALARMAQCLAPADPALPKERIHRSIKARRPDLMPPHWMRDVMVEAEALQATIQDAGLAAAREFLRRPDLVGHRCYMPRFRALRHLVLFNTEPAYRASFLQHSLRTDGIFPDGRTVDGRDANQAVLHELSEVSDWEDVVDTVIPSEALDAYPTDVEKRIRAGKLAAGQLAAALSRSAILNSWHRQIIRSFDSYWQTQLRFDLVRDHFGFRRKRTPKNISGIILHINEILSGPALGPHYHSGHRYDSMNFPLLSGVYYPTTIPENAVSKAGYLEIGRPDFQVPFDPVRVTVRPVAGSLIMFPAFAYHGVVPIDRSPRHSINIDVYVRARNTASWSVAEFFK